MTTAHVASERLGRDALSTYDKVFSQGFAYDRWTRIIALRSQPGFGVACRLRHAAIAGDYLGNPRLTDTLRRTARYLLLAIAMHLHDTRDANDPRSGLTAAALLAISAKRGVASSGLVRDFLHDMTSCGQFTRHRLEGDRRVVAYRPTLRLIASLGQWRLAVVPPLDRIYPQIALGVRLGEGPVADRQVRMSVARRCLIGGSVFAAFPEVRHFFQRSGGWSLLMHCAATLHGRTAIAHRLPEPEQ